MDMSTMDELALCAEKLGKIRAAHGADRHLHEAAAALSAFAGGLIGRMAGGEGAAPHGPQAAVSEPRGTTAAKNKAAGRRQKNRHAPAAGAPAEKKEKETSARTMGVCVICGGSYLRRSNVQKTCSADCLAKKRAGLDRDGQPLRAGDPT